MSAAPDIACNRYRGETNCCLPWKHEGDCQPATVVVVDRNLQPLNLRTVRRVTGSGRPRMQARSYAYKGRTEVSLMRDEEDGGGVSRQPVNCPAVRVGDRWVRRCPSLEVVEAR